MSNWRWLLVAVILLLEIGCGNSGDIVTVLPAQPVQSTDTVRPAATPDTATLNSATVCPPTRRDGTVPTARIAEYTLLCGIRPYSPKDQLAAAPSKVRPRT